MYNRGVGSRGTVCELPLPNGGRRRAKHRKRCTDPLQIKVPTIRDVQPAPVETCYSGIMPLNLILTDDGAQAIIQRGISSETSPGNLL